MAGHERTQEQWMKIARGVNGGLRAARFTGPLFHRLPPTLLPLKHSLLLDLEQSRADGHGDAHDDALAHSLNLVLPAVHCRVKQVVRGLLKGREHEHAVLHLGNAEAGDAKDLAL